MKEGNDWYKKGESELKWDIWIDRLRGEEPSAMAVLLFGSRATGDEGPYSDVDLRVITADDPVCRDRMYIEV